MKKQKRNEIESKRKEKRRRVEVAEEQENFTEDAEDIVKGLLAKTCKINFVSPIQVVEFNSSYLSRLKKLVLLALSDNLSLHLNCNWIYHVNFQIVRGIKKTEKDSESLYFSIHRRNSTANDSDDDENELAGFSRVFHGLFSSRGSTGRGMRYYVPSTKFQYLPLLLYSGLSAIWKSIEGTLKNTLNCFIVPLDMRTSAIKNFAGRWLMVNQLDNTISQTDKMSLSISCPSKSSLPFSQEVTFYIAQFEDIIKMYGRLDEVTTENVQRLWENLLSRLSRISRFNLHKFGIHKISSKNFEMSKGGTVKVKHPSLTTIQDLLSSLTTYAENSSTSR